MIKNVKISICIATWNRKDNLRKIIENLEYQGIERQSYEIIVCDSYSNDGTYEIMQNLRKKYKNLIYINDERNVLAVKRNIGIKKAQGEIVVFMDDDVIPSNNFIEAHLKAHNNAKNIIFCGQVRFPKVWIEKSNYYRFRDESHLNSKYSNLFNDLPFNKIVVMNMSFKKKEFLEYIGKVNEEFIGYGGEDIELGYRISKSPLKMIYLEEALAYHYEISESIIKYGEKIYKSGRDGAYKLNLVNPAILKNTKFKYLLKENKYVLKKMILNIIINKYFYYYISKYLLLTDKIKFLYSKKLYNYCIAYMFKRGIESQPEKPIGLEDVKNGWY